MSLDESVPTLRRPSTDARFRRTLPESLASLLVAAHDDEQQALGPQRRTAYLLTRQVISGLLTAGYPAGLLARELGVRSESIRTRAQAGWTYLADIAVLSGRDADVLLERCTRSGLVVDEEGRLHSDDIVTLLLAP